MKMATVLQVERRYTFSHITYQQRTVHLEVRKGSCPASSMWHICLRMVRMKKHQKQIGLGTSQLHGHKAVN